MQERPADIASERESDEQLGQQWREYAEVDHVWRERRREHEPGRQGHGRELDGWTPLQAGWLFEG